MRRRALLVCAGALSGCVNLAPSYEQPAAPVASAWPAGVATQGPPAAEVDWSEFYGDPALRELITLSLANNRDLRATALAIESARAQYRIVRAAELPAADGTVSSMAQRSNGITSRQVSVELGVSAFELDFFGRVRNLRDQALETFLASEESLRSARISLVASVAAAYATLLADQQRLRLAEDTLASQQKSFDLTKRTFEIGTASALDVAQAQTTLDTAQADIATYRTQVTQDLNALELLVGRPLDRSRDATATEPARDGALLALAATIGTPSEVPSAVLQRRPDVLAAERSLRAASADIGAARAARFPSISLTTSVGSASTQLSGLFGNGTSTWTFAPAVSLPIFDAGAGAATVRAAEVARESALAAYEKSIQTAFREVADALAQRRDIAQLLAARQSLVTANEKSFRLTEARYRRGVDSSLAALDAQRSFVSAQQNLITARLLEANNLITLYSVLGGGWR
jgi:outer membrane protein, multidrug efflux system